MNETDTHTLPEVILLATGNVKKLGEIQQVFAETGLQRVKLLVLADLPEDIPEPVEDGETFAENAEIKAKAYARATGRWCLADDSGLVVDALGGEPGIHSARYSGVEGSRSERDRANNEKLLLSLSACGAEGEKRSARFVCCMCLVDERGNVVHRTRGEMEGVIGDSPRGSNGFGYDPLLILPEGMTVAELEAEEKNRRSHRGQATRAMAAFLASL